VSEHVWSEEGTSPSAIETALRELLKERYSEDEDFVPARVLNLVVVADRQWRGEIENRLDRVGRYHPSRTVLCAVEPRRSSLDAFVMIGSDDDAENSGAMTLGHERVVVDVGAEQLAHLGSIVDPLVVTDLATVVWAPHGHREAVDSLMRLAQVVLLDSVEEPSLADALSRAAQLAGRAYVVDLAWLRSTPWRERIAATFDPAAWRPELRRISSVTVRHRPDSAAAGLLLFGWLATRLGWEPGSLVSQNGAFYGRAKAGRGDVVLRLAPDERQSAPGLAGITIETAAGMSISLDRGPGGLSAKRRTRDGGESSWTVMGASRGEAGILGEGIRQALLRDPTYAPALAAAGAMVT
jgi:glucose-6-phosphate dehydrogenase assembly protein OpcA